MVANPPPHCNRVGMVAQWPNDHTLPSLSSSPSTSFQGASRPLAVFPFSLPSLSDLVTYERTGHAHAGSFPRPFCRSCKNAQRRGILNS